MMNLDEFGREKLTEEIIDGTKVSFWVKLANYAYNIYASHIYQFQGQSIKPFESNTTS